MRAEAGRRLPRRARVPRGGWCLGAGRAPQRWSANLRGARAWAGEAGGVEGPEEGAGEGPTTFVPRSPGITDGAWDRRDEAAVREALQQSDKSAARETRRLEVGRRTGPLEVAGPLLGRSLPQMQALAEALGWKKFRGQQLHTAVYKWGARDLDGVRGLSEEHVAQLTAAGVTMGRAEIVQTVESKDGTCKFLLKLGDGRVVETVGIPERSASGGKRGKGGREEGASPSSPSQGRLTVCVSSQVGCPMRCTFCATGKGGFARSLLPHEIVDQVLTVRSHFDRRVSNVVFMGMGEPLLNLPNVLAAFRAINEDIGIGARSVTISTVGVPNTLDRMAQEELQLTLAVSLHAPNQKLRETLVPSAKAYPLPALLEDCKRYFTKTGRRVSFEYTLMKGVNDGEDHAKQLAALLSKSGHRGAHVNLIPYNPVAESDYARPESVNAGKFKRVLEDLGITASVRVTRGLDAAAACGQLRNEYQKAPMEEVLPAGGAVVSALPS